MGTRLRLALLKEIPDDADLRRQWNALALRAERPQVFYTYEWAVAVYRAYHATLKPLLFLAYEEQESLYGVAALAADPASQKVSFLCATTGDYCDFLSSPGERDAFVGTVLAELRKQGINDLALANLPADSLTVPALRNHAGHHGYHCFARTAYMCAQVVLGELERRGQDKPALPRKKMLRRFLNAMGRENPVRLDHAHTWAAAESVLPELMQAHVARFLATGRISVMARPERRTFLAELGKLLSDSGWLTISRMMSGDQTFAWQYGFQFAGTWFWYQPTFDSDFEKYSPGFCMLSKVIEEAADDPAFNVVDLGLGAEGYKERFANCTRETLFVTLKTSVSAHYGEMARHRAASLAMKSPKVEAGLRQTRTKAQRVKQRLDLQGPAATVGWFAGRMQHSLWDSNQVFFYKWNQSLLADTKEFQIRVLDLNWLAKAVPAYIDDDETLAYLVRAAQRLRSGKAQGFVLVDTDGKPLHFAWYMPFDGFFLSELNAPVEAASPDDVMLFDCWTPVALRGRGYYGHAVELIAGHLQPSGKYPWIFSAAENKSSMRGLAKTGFCPQYSLCRKKMLLWQTVTGQPVISSNVHAAEVSARVS